MRVVWTSAALVNLEELQDYIAQDSPVAAYRVASALTSRTQDSLPANPMLGRRGRARGTREFVFGDLPYIVVYRVTSEIEILAVVHTARDWPDDFGDH